MRSARAGAGLKQRFFNSFLALVLISQAFIFTGQKAHGAGAEKPKLVVVMVADQFCYDYLSRYSEKFATGGFKYLLDNGANFVNCRYQDVVTQTAPGHSIISTGAYPWATGVVANSWYSRGERKPVMAVGSDRLNLVGANGKGAGTRRMLGTTIGDQMKLSTNGRSKVITASLKDRGALFLAGHMANNAFWWDMRSGTFVSSSQYGSVLPGWVKSFNDQHYADTYFGKPWQRLLPENQYIASTRDNYSWERPIPGDGVQFPHVVSGGASSPGGAYYNAFAMTPWANQMLADFAKQAIERERLGQHQECDFLGISFSAGDYLGHAFGPYSQEVEDLVLRLDQTLMSFFQYLDQKVGLNKCVIVFTADHGVMPAPEFLKAKGFDAGRIDPGSFKRILDAALDSRLGEEDWVEAFQPPNLYLNLDAIDKQKYRQPDVEALAAKIARSVPGVGDVYTAVQFFLNQLPSGPKADLARRSYFWGRSGELMVLTKPGYIFTSKNNGTTHGSCYAYDSQVPLIISGTQVRGGRYDRNVSPADIAPTIAAILGIQAPALCEGQALSEALAQVQGPVGPRMKVQTTDKKKKRSRSRRR